MLCPARFLGMTLPIRLARECGAADVECGGLPPLSALKVVGEVTCPNPRDRTRRDEHLRRRVIPLPSAARGLDGGNEK